VGTSLRWTYLSGVERVHALSLRRSVATAGLIAGFNLSFVQVSLDRGSLAMANSTAPVLDGAGRDYKESRHRCRGQPRPSEKECRFSRGDRKPFPKRTQSQKGDPEVGLPFCDAKSRATWPL